MNCPYCDHPDPELAEDVAFCLHCGLFSKMTVDGLKKLTDSDRGLLDNLNRAQVFRWEAMRIKALGTTREQLAGKLL